MRLLEVETTASQLERLTALAQFLTGRAEDQSAKKIISTRSFIAMANNMGIPITDGQLRDLSQQQPLNQLISNIDDNQIIFQGAEDIGPTQMSVDQARATVDSMAKRAAKSAI